MSLHIPDPRSVDFTKAEENKSVDFKAAPISWYCTKDALRCDAGFCGQDESAFRFLHLPKNMSSVRFDLNRTHPDDQLRLDSYVSDEDISDLLSWVQDMSHLNDERYFFLFITYILQDAFASNKY